MHLPSSAMFYLFYTNPNRVNEELQLIKDTTNSQNGIANYNIMPKLIYPSSSSLTFKNFTITSMSIDNLINYTTLSSIIIWYFTLIVTLGLPLNAYTCAVVLNRRKPRKSWPYLMAICATDCVYLLCFSMHIVRVYFTNRFNISEQQQILCKIGVFTLNTIECIACWLWIIMVAQNILTLFYPSWEVINRYHSVLYALYIIGGGVGLSILAQIWTLFLMEINKEVYKCDVSRSYQIHHPQRIRLGPIFDAINVFITYLLPFFAILAINITVMRKVAMQRRRLRKSSSNNSYSALRALSHSATTAGSGATALRHSCTDDEIVKAATARATATNYFMTTTSDTSVVVAKRISFNSNSTAWSLTRKLLIFALIDLTLNLPYALMRLYNTATLSQSLSSTRQQYSRGDKGLLTLATTNVLDAQQIMILLCILLKYSQHILNVLYTNYLIYNNVFPPFLLLRVSNYIFGEAKSRNRRTHSLKTNQTATCV